MSQDYLNLERRHQTEKEFFDRQALLEQNADLCMSKFVGRYQNPSSVPVYPKEYMFHLLGDMKNKLVLDYGCGNGENSVLLAKCGATVYAFDISPEMCRLAEERAKVNSVASQINISCCAGERTEYPENFFDIVSGFAVLHHLDMDMTCKEIHRILKPGGIALFAEPVAFSLAYRVIKRLLRKVIAPPQNVTPTERQLTEEDLRIMQKYFGVIKCTHFGLLERLLKIQLLNKFENCIYELDYKLLNVFPVLRRYCVYVTLLVMKTDGGGGR